MIRNPEQTIGKLADNAGYAVCTFIDEQGYPETQTLPQPLRREGIREFLFDIDPTAFALTPLTGSCPASLYFMDQRFYRGVCLKGWLMVGDEREEILEDAGENEKETTETTELAEIYGGERPLLQPFPIVGFSCLRGEAVMDKVEKLWRSVQESGVPVLKLTFAEIEEILGFPMDHAFLSYKKNSLAYGYEVKKISLKEKTVVFCQRI